SGGQVLILSSICVGRRHPAITTPCRSLRRGRDACDRVVSSGRCRDSKRFRAGREGLRCLLLAVSRWLRKLAALPEGRADRGGGDDPEQHERRGAEEPEAESEGERLAEGVVACDEVVRPAGRDGGQDADAAGSADLFPSVA